jgi:hypothetical protein
MALGNDRLVLFLDDILSGEESKFEIALFSGFGGSRGIDLFGHI